MAMDSIKRFPLEFHTRIAQLSINHFKTFPKTGKPNADQWTVMSTIVEHDASDLIVVALGTGSKCIGSHICKQGMILNDSHAEVICRRSFIRYLYQQMLDVENSKVMSFNASTKTFSLNRGIEYHFFTTHVPCGDAAIIPKLCEDDTFDLVGDLINIEDHTCEEPKQKVAKMVTDVYRTGAKCLPESIVKDSRDIGSRYHVTGVIRTKPGRGEPTLSLSCSDKIAKWSAVGIQGALLSSLLDEPIFLKSFTIVGKTPFDSNSAERAFFRFVKEVQPNVEKMEIAQVADIVFEFSKCSNKNPSPSSIAFAKNCKTEVIVHGRRYGLTRKDLDKGKGEVSICRKNLFKLYSQIIKQKKPEVLGESHILSYSKSKLSSTQYNRLKARLVTLGYVSFSSQKIYNFNEIISEK